MMGDLASAAAFSCIAEVHGRVEWTFETLSTIHEWMHETTLQGGPQVATALPKLHEAIKSCEQTLHTCMNELAELHLWMSGLDEDGYIQKMAEYGVAMLEKELSEQ